MEMNKASTLVRFAKALSTPMMRAAIELSFRPVSPAGFARGNPAIPAIPCDMDEAYGHFCN